MRDTPPRAPTSPVVPLAVADGTRTALQMPDGALTFDGLDRAVAATSVALTARVDDHGSGTGPTLVAVPAVARTSTVVALLGALDAGLTVVPVNVSSGPDELAHVLSDASPRLVVAPDHLELPGPLAALPRLWADPVDPVDPVEAGRASDAVVAGRRPSAADPALVIYTSGTTGPPKGVVLSHHALACDLDALALAWNLRPDDVVVHALPLFHVHGLVLATLGPLRIGATTRHLGRFDVADLAEQFRTGATVMYGVPTMYHRLADALDDDPALARTVATARLLVSGSAGLAAHDRDRIRSSTGRPVLERYGMTETLITCAMTVDGSGEAGSVGPPLPGIELRLVEDDGTMIPAADLGTVGEIHVRGETLFSGYLGRPDATEASYTSDGWFRTGDLATWSPTGAVRISGRRSVDLIKSGGYRIGAGEIENVLLTHPGVAEVAVTGEPDPDLGERIVAWVVRVPGLLPSADDLVSHVTDHLAAHKRPRRVHFVETLPRNDLGKVLKRSLGMTVPPPTGAVPSP